MATHKSQPARMAFNGEVVTPMWVVAINVVFCLAYTCVTPLVFPEWGVPVRHGLSIICMITAFVPFKNRNDRLRMYAVSFCVVGMAFVVEMACISDMVSGSAWGVASGCEHHIPGKALILGAHFSMACMPLMYDVMRRHTRSTYTKLASTE
jgi:hypothetical protein